MLVDTLRDSNASGCCDGYLRALGEIVREVVPVRPTSQKLGRQLSIAFGNVNLSEESWRCLLVGPRPLSILRRIDCGLTLHMNVLESFSMDT